MKKLKIIYEDKYLIVVDKEPKLLTISDHKENERTLYHEVSSYVKKQNKNNKIFIVHRLDKDTSGLIVFAKNIKIKKILQDNWNNTKREYVAIVCGELKGNGTIKNYLFQTKSLQVFSSKNPRKGKLAITEYSSIKSNKNYSLIKINILTGRRHQIRAHMNEINHPILGDKLYGNKLANRLYLHAIKLEFYHPILEKNISLESKIPDEFMKYL